MTPQRIAHFLVHAIAAAAAIVAGAYMILIPEFVAVVGVDPAIDLDRAAYLLRMPVINGAGLRFVGLLVLAAGVLLAVTAGRFVRSTHA